MRDGLLERIVSDSGVPDLVEVLAERLAPTDLQSLMMEVYRRRSARVSPPELLERYGADRFSRPATTAPAAVAAFEQLAWSLLPEGYEAVELSPLCPLGTNSAMATVDQNKVVRKRRERHRYVVRVEVGEGVAPALVAGMAPGYAAPARPPVHSAHEPEAG